MSLTLKVVGNVRQIPMMLHTSRAMYSGDSDKSGAVKDAGGSFAKKGAADEEQHFRKLQAEQLKNLKGHLKDEISHHEDEIKRHQEAIARMKEKAKKLESQK